MDLPSVHPPVKIASELCIENCNVNVIDSWSFTDDKNKAVQEELEKCDVILLVYDVTKTHTIDRIASYWLDYIPKYSSAPILIIGNKHDLKRTNPTYSLEDTIKNLSKNFHNFDIVIECSAKTLYNLSDIFFYTQVTVLHPTLPLFNPITEELTDKFKRSLSLVFKTCDKDKDFALSTDEIIAMHLSVYETPMQAAEAEDIIKMIQSSYPQGISKDGINFEGFCYLQKLAMQRLQNSVCWGLVKHFRYDRSLELVLDLDLGLLETDTVEISISTISFLTAVFDQYAQDAQLKISSLPQIFAASKNPPWGKDTESWGDVSAIIRTENNALPYTSWISLWHLLAFQNYKQCLKYLMFIGCDLNFSDVFVIKKRGDLASRKVAIEYLVGYNGVGKSWFLNGFINQKTDGKPTSSIKTCCNVIEESYVPWDNKHLILIEYPVIEIEKMLKDIKLCDCLVLVYNHHIPQSYKFICEIQDMASASGIKKYVLESNKIQLEIRDDVYKDIYKASFFDIEIGMQKNNLSINRYKAFSNKNTILVGLGLFVVFLSYFYAI